MNTNNSARKVLIFAVVVILVAGAVFGISGCFKSLMPNQHSEYRPIHEFVRKDDIAWVTTDLEKHPEDANVKDDEEAIGLHLAALTCSTSMTLVLISSTTNIDSLNKYGASPLHISSQRNCVTNTLVLINNGAEVNLKDKNRQTPYRRAKDREAYKAMSILKQHGGKE